MPETPLIEVWRSQAIVLLRNGHTMTELLQILAEVANKVAEEARA